MIQNYLTNNAERYASKWLVLIIDVVIVMISFVLSYLIRFNLTLDFDVEKLFVQIPWICLMFLCSFFIIGSYKGVVRHAGVQDVYNLFNAICLASILIIFLVVFNNKYQIAEDFTIPLSIIIINSLIVKKGISEVIFCIQGISHKRLKSLVEGLVDFPVLVKIVPPVEDWINGELKVSQIKNIQIEDLLNRAPIDLNNSNIERELYNKTVLVTGGAGSIGSELVRQICSFNHKSLIIIDQAESALYDLQQELKQKGFHNFIPIVADVRDKKRMNMLFEEYKPNMVFHAAAYKHVPLMEYNYYEAIKINVAGTKTIVDLAMNHKVNKCLQHQSNTRYITTRFGNVLGSNGSVIPLFRKQIENGGPLTLTHKDITRYFMTIPEASQLVLEAGSMGVGGEIFIFDMGESVKIFDLAKNMIKLSGLQYPEDIDIRITGLRPGEKLYEELLANGENTLPTYHKKIKISKTRDLEYEKLKSLIDELCISNTFFGDNTVKLMKQIVPEFISNNSEFCELDKKESITFKADKKIQSNQPHSALKL